MPAAIAVVVGFVFGIIFLAGLLDMLLELWGEKPLGYVLPRWAKAFPLYSAGLVLVMGALLGHFFLHVPRP
jgi:hypothetical protein